MWNKEVAIEIKKKLLVYQLTSQKASKTTLAFFQNAGNTSSAQTLAYLNYEEEEEDSKS